MRKRADRHEDLAQQDSMERSDEVAASASRQGDGEPAEPGGVAEAVEGDQAASGTGAPDSYMTTDGNAGSTAAAGGGTSQRALDEQRDRYLRLAAEYDNYRKRTARERQEERSRAQADLVKQLIDALDDLARFAHVDPATVDAATIVQGVDMVEKKVHKALSAAGLEIVNPADQAFDPNRHEAVMTEPALSSEDDHMVGRVFQPGYIFNGQLLRPARVTVKQWNG